MRVTGKTRKATIVDVFARPSKLDPVKINYFVKFQLRTGEVVNQVVNEKAYWIGEQYAKVYKFRKNWNFMDFGTLVGKEAKIKIRRVPSFISGPGFYAELVNK